MMVRGVEQNLRRNACGVSFMVSTKIVHGFGVVSSSCNRSPSKSHFHSLVVSCTVDRAVEPPLIHLVLDAAPASPPEVKSIADFDWIPHLGHRTSMRYRAPPQGYEAQAFYPMSALQFEPCEGLVAGPNSKQTLYHFYQLSDGQSVWAVPFEKQNDGWKAQWDVLPGS